MQENLLLPCRRVLGSIAVLHHNRRKTNYHIHLIFSERELLDEPSVKMASRNMFYDENGKHVRTKKEICTEDGSGRVAISLKKARFMKRICLQLTTQNLRVRDFWVK